MRMITATLLLKSGNRWNYMQHMLVFFLSFLSLSWIYVSPSHVFNSNPPGKSTGRGLAAPCSFGPRRPGGNYLREGVEDKANVLELFIKVNYSCSFWSPKARVVRVCLTPASLCWAGSTLRIKVLFRFFFFSFPQINICCGFLILSN